MGTPLDENGQPVILALNADRLNDRAIDELVGICKGVLADGMVLQQEAEFLLRWIDRNRRYATVWPGNIIYARLGYFLQDGNLDTEEQRELLDLLLDVTGEKLETMGAENHSTALPLDSPAPDLVIPGSTFCFTGKFVYGGRKKCQADTEARGGICIDGVTRALKYLVIGSIGSDQWMHTTHGRKIELAVEYRDVGLPLAIVSEEHWTRHLTFNSKPMTGF